LYVGLFDVVGLYHNTILFALKKALRRHRDVDNQNESLVCLCARKSEVQALNGGLAYGLKEPIGPHFRYFIACFTLFHHSRCLIFNLFDDAFSSLIIKSKVRTDHAPIGSIPCRQWNHQLISFPIRTRRLQAASFNAML